MISERALKAQRDKSHFSTSLSLPNLSASASALMHNKTNTDLPTPAVQGYKGGSTSACYEQLLQITRVCVVCTMFA